MNDPSRNNDMNGVAALAPVAAAGAGVFIAGSILVGVGRWFADMYRGIAHIARGSGTDSMAILDQRIATADLIAIGALADLRVERVERDVMIALAGEDPELEAELRDAFARWQARPDVMTDDLARREALRAAAARLTSGQRSDLREVVAAYGTTTDALPPPEAAHPYREAASERSRTLRDELLVALA